ncbi:hypothetical protein ACQUSY_12090 [Microbacterium sp. YY-03]|uniref:hypothetical protein n=1 Tax=Microbacterium sp. YY-03 TaxID=3421636 RepID=UPI003D164549
MTVPLRASSAPVSLESLREQIERAERRRADTAVIPVSAPLVPLFFDGGLKPGATYAIDSSISVMLSLMAEPSTAGSWCAAVGFDSLSAEAAEGFGVALERFVMVPHPGDRWLAVVAALAEVIPVIAIRPPSRPHDADVARLSARLRERGGVLLVLGEWPGSEATLSLSEASWRGIGNGYGALQSRAVTISARGRRFPAARRTRVLLPGPAGAVVPFIPAAAPAHVADDVAATDRRAHLTVVA